MNDILTETIIHEIEIQTSFLTYRDPHLRYGQAMFNACCEFIPEIADRIRGTDKDCFHNDKKVVDFLEEVRQELKKIKL